jgi:hypothetical protein
VRDWILGLINDVTGPIRRFAESVQQRVAAVWFAILRVFGGIRTAWGRLYQRVKAAGAWVREGLAELYWTAKWLVTVWIPRNIHAAKVAVLNWTRARLYALEALARRLIRAAVHMLSRSLSLLRDWTRRLIDDVRKAIALLIAGLRRVRDIVFALLLDPRKLAQWAAGAMTTAILRYLDGRKDAIGRWLLNRSVSFTVWFARQLDGVLGRIL